MYHFIYLCKTLHICEFVCEDGHKIAARCWGTRDTRDAHYDIYPEFTENQVCTYTQNCPPSLRIRDAHILRNMKAR